MVLKYGGNVAEGPPQDSVQRGAPMSVEDDDELWPSWWTSLRDRELYWAGGYLDARARLRPESGTDPLFTPPLDTPRWYAPARLEVTGRRADLGALQGILGLGRFYADGRLVLRGMNRIAACADLMLPYLRPDGSLRDELEDLARLGRYQRVATKGPPPACWVPDCDRPRLIRGLCRAHYARRLRTGVPFKEQSLSDHGCLICGYGDTPVRWSTPDPRSRGVPVCTTCDSVRQRPIAAPRGRRPGHGTRETAPRSEADLNLDPVRTQALATRAGTRPAGRNSRARDPRSPDEREP